MVAEVIPYRRRARAGALALWHIVARRHRAILGALLRKTGGPGTPRSAQVVLAFVVPLVTLALLPSQMPCSYCPSG